MYFNSLTHRPYRSMGRNFWQNINKNKELTEMEKMVIKSSQFMDILYKPYKNKS